MWYTLFTLKHKGIKMIFNIIKWKSTSKSKNKGICDPAKVIFTFFTKVMFYYFKDKIILHDVKNIQ